MIDLRKHRLDRNNFIRTYRINKNRRCLFSGWHLFALSSSAKCLHDQLKTNVSASPSFGFSISIFIYCGNESRCACSIVPGRSSKEAMNKWPQSSSNRMPIDKYRNITSQLWKLVLCRLLSERLHVCESLVAERPVSTKKFTKCRKKRCRPSTLQSIAAGLKWKMSATNNFNTNCHLLFWLDRTCDIRAYSGSYGCCFK